MLVMVDIELAVIVESFAEGDLLLVRRYNLMVVLWVVVGIWGLVFQFLLDV